MNKYEEYAYKQIRLNLPENVKIILDVLHEHGHEAFIVGGCVRDALMQTYYPRVAKTPSDWDITTSATPDEVITLFRKTIDKAKEYGTVTIIMDNGELYEVTTYREDVGYSNHRKPDKVKFTSSLITDCKRRDFTINSLAYSDETGLIDICHGMDDIFEGTIRCIGDANARFEEDALRILRALRFASTFGFTIDKETETAIDANLDLLDHISAERKFMELHKLSQTPLMAEVLRAHKNVLFKIIPELAVCENFDQKNPHHDKDVLEHIFETVRTARAHKATPEITIAALLHDIGKPETFELVDGVGRMRHHPAVSERIAHDILTRFNCSNQFKDDVCFLVKYHDVNMPETKQQARRFLTKFTRKQIDDLCLLHLCDTFAHSVMNVRIYGPALQQAMRLLEETELEMKAENAAFSLKDLCVNGNDIKALGLKGPDIGRVLNQLLDEVVDGSLKNERFDLLARANTMKNM